MFNKQYLILFSIVYLIGMIVCGFIQNVFILSAFNGMFMLGSVWAVFHMCNSNNSNRISTQVKNVKDTECVKEQENEHVDIETINPESIKTNTLPDINDEIYIGEIISEDDFKDMMNDDKTWYKHMSKRIDESVQNLHKNFLTENEQQQ